MKKVAVCLVLFSAFQLLQRVADATDVTPPVGQSFFIAKKDLLGEELLGGSDILMLNNTQDCFVCDSMEIVDDSASYFENTNSFYSSITETYSLGIQLKKDFTLGVTLDATTRSVSETNRTIKGSTLSVESKVGQCVIRPECIYDESYHTMSSNFLSDFENLPRDIGAETIFNIDLSAYDHFFNQFGSHIVTGVTYGSKMYQHCFSKSEKEYSQRDYTVRACIALSGGIGKVSGNISACAGISEEEAEASTRLDVTTRLVLRGGTKETRTQLYADRTSELIAKFLNEANLEEPISYSFTPVWTLLAQRYLGTEHFIKVRYLEAYYLGYLNFGCQTLWSADDTVRTQLFYQTFASFGSDVPVFICDIPCAGCSQNRDCHYGPGVYCRCVGDTCFKQETRILSTGEERTYVVANYDYWNYWGNCKQVPGAAECVCDQSKRYRTKIWEQDKDTAEMLRFLHSKAQSARSAHLGSTPKSSKEEL